VSGNETVQGLIDEVKSKFVELKNSTILAPKNKIPNLNANEILIL